jgi:hypothetical protein
VTRATSAPLRQKRDIARTVIWTEVEGKATLEGRARDYYRQIPNMEILCGKQDH